MSCLLRLALLHFHNWHRTLNMTELDRLSISTFDIISGTSGKGDKLKKDDGAATDNQKEILYMEYSLYQSFNHLRCEERSWNVCYGTTFVVLLFYFALWLHFHKKEMNNV